MVVFRVFGVFRGLLELALGLLGYLNLSAISPPQFTRAPPQSRRPGATPLPCNTRMPVLNRIQGDRQ
jgi:hypothetical protein